MARRVSETLTERESQLMHVIWRLGEASAEQVRAALADDSHDSTVRTLLRILESKGYLTHEARGKLYIYRPAIDRRQAQGHILGHVLARFFGGSAEDLVLHLIEDERLTPEQLEELRRGLADAGKTRAKRSKKRSDPKGKERKP